MSMPSCAALSASRTIVSALKSKYAASQLFRSTGLACPAYFPLQIWFLISPWNIRESFPSPLSVCPRITSGSTSSSPGSSGYRKYSLCSPIITLVCPN